ncbi:MAG TPA: ABC transporter substrate-binding protein [Stellaceae bacterium]|nr:ABC transporter substrate-binding protein [Stellaceae bacterium]
MRMWIALGLAALVGLAGGRAEAQATKELNVIVFPGGSNWPIWVAQEKGYFAKNGVAVKLTPTPGSAFQLSNTIDGKFDIAMTAIDNAIAYDEGQGEAQTTQKAELVAVMGSDNGFLHVVSVPEVPTMADLRGKTLSVDALTTGYAFVLEKMLQRGGLKAGDYTLVRAGGGLQRFEALMKKEHAATLLFTPFELIAEDKGFHDLGAAIDVLGHYQGLVAAVQRSWAKAHRAELVGYIRGYVAGLDWLYRPGNKAEAIEILRKNITTMSPELAQKTYGVLLAPRNGLLKQGRIDMAGVKTVLALRSEYGEPRKKLTDPGKYVDLSYYKRAMAK